MTKDQSAERVRETLKSLRDAYGDWKHERVDSAIYVVEAVAEFFDALGRKGAPAILALADSRPVGEPEVDDDPVLPHDITVGPVCFRRGVKLSTFVASAIRWYERAAATYPAVGPLPRPPVEGASK